jgi:cytochrome c1
LAWTTTSAAAELSRVELDRSPDALKRGARVVTEVCMGCHSLRHLKYRELAQLGFTPEELDTLRGEHGLEEPMLGAMDDETATLSFGLLPPDQSTLAKAREGGGRYIFTFVTSYQKDATGNTVNVMVPATKMPDVFDYASLGPNDREAVRQQVRDAAVFLEWASDPRAAARKSLGKYVIAYLVVITFLLYLLKRRVWARLPPSTL